MWKLLFSSFISQQKLDHWFHSTSLPAHTSHAKEVRMTTTVCYWKLRHTKNLFSSSWFLDLSGASFFFFFHGQTKREVCSCSLYTSTVAPMMNPWKWSYSTRRIESPKQGAFGSCLLYWELRCRKYYSIVAAYTAFFISLFFCSFWLYRYPYVTTIPQDNRTYLEKPLPLPDHFLKSPSVPLEGKLKLSVSSVVLKTKFKSVQKVCEHKYWGTVSTKY